ncbi:hypothetical protein [Acinetobacter bereziniae]|uniref:hypothetical protein n=1 Tax=Acinetobacter bereziniae TaxID=106648 RepID=UPI0030094CCF
MTKYDWSNVPKEVKWIATDDNGLTFGYPNKPVKEMYFGEVRWNNEKYIPLFMGNVGYVGNWQDSLEERPTETDLPETVAKSLGEVA